MTVEATSGVATVKAMQRMQQPLRRCTPVIRPATLSHLVQGLGLSSKRRRTCAIPRAAGGDSQQDAPEDLLRGGKIRQAVRSSEEDWRRSVRERVAREAAAERATGRVGGTGINLAVRPSPGSPREAKHFTAVSGSAAVLTMALGVSAIANAVGVDVFSRLHVPQDPATFAHTCAAWTAPAVAATVAFWAGIFFGPKTEVSQIFRNETLDASAVVEGETAASMALAGALLACAEGVVFRGTGIALASDMFAGVPPIETTTDLLHVQLFPECHLPIAWVWPFVVLGAASMEAAVEALSQDGVNGMDRGCIADMLASSLMTETAEVQHAADSPSGQEIRRGGELVKLETIPASSLIRASEHFSRAFREQYRRQQHMYAGPGMILARAAFLSTEVVLTDSLLAGLLTGAACEAAQSLVSLRYIKGETERQ